MENNFIAPAVELAFKDNSELSNLSSEQETLLSPDSEYLTATPDGLSEDFQLEFKSVDPRKNVKIGPDPKHVRQTHVQMGVFGRKKTYLIYFNSSNYYDVTVWEVNYDEEVYKKAIDRANRIMQHIHNWQKLPKEGIITGECQFCEYKRICFGEEDMKHSGGKGNKKCGKKKGKKKGKKNKKC